jgi:hypothetical protein
MSDTDINSIMGHEWNASSMNNVLITESPYNQECYISTPAPETPNGINLAPDSMRYGSSEEVAMAADRSPTESVNIIPQDNVRAVTNERIFSTVTWATGGICQGFSGNIDGYMSSNTPSQSFSMVSKVCEKDTTNYGLNLAIGLLYLHNWRWFLASPGSSPHVGVVPVISTGKLQMQISTHSCNTARAYVLYIPTRVFAR